MKGFIVALGVLILSGPALLLMFLFGSAGASPTEADAAAMWVRERETVPFASTGAPGGFVDQAWTTYVVGTEQSRERYPGCHVRPQILAAIAEIESNQGTFGGSSVDPATGDVYPPIIGIALDGTNGTAEIADTDGGYLDGDEIWDRAVGPFQFIPSSWAIFGGDGNGDGVADPHNMADAAVAAAAHLCASYAVDFDDHPDLLRAALFDYNNSIVYVEKVLELTRVNDDKTPDFVVGDDAPAVGDYALPIPEASIRSGQLVRPHHEYPAIDLGIPPGTPLYAMTSGGVTKVSDDEGRCGGTVVLEGDDGVQYTYCHLSQVGIAAQTRVTPGQFLGYSGGVPGTPGAGNTTGPHLHLSMRIRGVSHCPQTLLISIQQGQPINPDSTPTQGCTN